MKVKIILFSFSLFLFANIGFAQKSKAPKSIIPKGVSIKKYHSKGELERMPKGELLTLYTERTSSLVRILPYIAFATKPGVTMATLGIPVDNSNIKLLDSQLDASGSFLESTVEFQQKFLPYSDTSKLIAAILFYEETMKSLHVYSDFN